MIRKLNEINQIIFLQSGKTLRKVGNFEGSNLKPDILFINDEELILIEVDICFEDLVSTRINQKNEKYEKLFVELIRTYSLIKSNYILIVVTTNGILASVSRIKLKDIGIKIDETKIMREILFCEMNYLMNNNKDEKLLLQYN